MMLPFAAIIIGTMISAWAALSLKKGAAAFSLTVRGSIGNVHIVIGGVLYVAATLLYLVGLAQLPLAIAFPLTSLTYVWSALLAKRFLKEDIPLLRWVGIGVIFAGTLLAVQP